MNPAVIHDRDQARAGLRGEHKVQLISLEQEGSAFEQLPPGVYGFTYAPATETPLFQRHSYGSFEVHKLADGSGRLIGCCSAEDAAALRRGGEIFEVTLYPHEWGDATEIVTVPFDWLLTDLYRPVRRDGGAVALRLSTTG